MDAANHPLSRIALLFSAALLLPAGAFAQAATLTPAATQVTLQGQTPVQDNITSAGAQVTFNATTTYAAGDPAWLTINAQASTDSLTGLTTPTSLFIRTGGSAGLLSAGTHNATINLAATDGSGLTASIAVSFTTGTFTGVGAVITPSVSSISVSIAYQGSTQVPLTLTTTSGSQVSFTLLSTVPWIQVVQASGTPNAVSSSLPAVFTITLTGAGQAQTQLNGALTLTPSQGAPVSIPVALGNGVTVGSGGGGGGTSSGSLSVSQNPVAMTYVAGSGVFPSATVTVNGNSQITYFATITSSNNWLLANNQTNFQFSAGATFNLSADANAASLTPGATYQATVALSGTDGSLLNLIVNLTVTGSNTSGITVSPNPIALSAPLNGSTTSQVVTITSANAGALSVSVTGSGLSVSNPSVTSLAAGQSTAVTVFGSPTGLNNNTYSGTLFVNVGSGSYTDPVTFTVGTGSGGATSSTVVAAPSTLNFTYENGGNMQASQSANIFLGGSGNYTAAATTQSGSNWLSISNQNGTLPASFYTIVANAAGLIAGQYQGTVTFTNTTDGSTSTVTVHLNVTNTTAIYSNPVSLVFNAVGGAASPQSLTILSSDGTTVPISLAVSTQTSAPWLSVTGGSGTTQNGTYQVSVNPANLTNGVYTGYLTAAANTGNSPITIPVALSVTGSTGGGGGTGSLTLGQSSLTFNVPTGSSTASTQQLTVTAANPVSFTASAATNGVGNTTWLTISPSGNLATNTTLTVSANPSGLAAGSYGGTITLVSPGGTQTVGVTMVVGTGTGGATGNLSVSVNGGAVTTTPTVSFNAPSVGATVAAQYISVTSASGSAPVSFTAALSGTSCGWVNLGIVANQTYQTPINNLNIGATTTSLAAGTYNCTLTLTPSGGTAVTVPLSLVVVGVPTITVPSTPVTFTYAAGAANPEPQTVSVTSSDPGATAFTATASSTGSWLSVSPASASATSAAPATLTITANPANLNAGTYNGTITVTAGTGAVGGGTINVTLTITAPTPVISMIVNGASFLGGAVSPGEFISILGTSLGPITPVGPTLNTNGTIATAGGNVQVFFNSTPAPLTYVSSGQINCLVPYEVNGASTIAVQVKFFGQPSNTMNVNIAQSAPGIFSSNASGTGQAAVLNANNTPNTSGNAATRGTPIQIFMTGEGITTPAQADGAVMPNATTVPKLPVAVTIGGQPATVVFEGEAPGIVAGVLQLNVTVPTTVQPGANALVVTIGSVSSQPNLTISVQ